MGQVHRNIQGSVTYEVYERVLDSVIKMVKTNTKVNKNRYNREKTPLNIQEQV